MIVLPSKEISLLSWWHLYIESDLTLHFFLRLGKITLEGNTAQKLDQLDRRETELLEEADKQRAIIKRLKEDRAHYRRKTEEKEWVAGSHAEELT